MQHVQLSWLGPFVLLPQPGFRTVFDVEGLEHAGLYLWTVEYAGGYLVNYAGEGSVLPSRIGQNRDHGLAGKDGLICDPVLFRQGKIKVTENFSAEEFRADKARLSEAIREFYLCYRIFVALSDADQRTRKFIEAGIIRTLRAAGGPVAEFLYNKRLINASPEPFQAHIETGGVLFHGLGDVIDC